MGRDLGRSGHHSPAYCKYAISFARISIRLVCCMEMASNRAKYLQITSAFRVCFRKNPGGTSMLLACTMCVLMFDNFCMFACLFDYYEEMI